MWYLLFNFFYGEIGAHLTVACCWYLVFIWCGFAVRARASTLFQLIHVLMHEFEAVLSSSLCEVKELSQTIHSWQVFTLKKKKTCHICQLEIRQKKPYGRMSLNFLLGQGLCNLVHQNTLIFCYSFSEIKKKKILNF